jgi:hypothetical protein
MESPKWTLCPLGENVHLKYKSRQIENPTAFVFDSIYPKFSW